MSVSPPPNCAPDAALKANDCMRIAKRRPIATPPTQSGMDRGMEEGTSELGDHPVR
jgi:hypothetical protein